VTIDAGRRLQDRLEPEEVRKVSMTHRLAVLFSILLLAGCNQTFEPPQPVPGSITYRGQPSQKLTLSPIGSRLQHHFTDDMGRDVFETYILQPDRSLKLVSREYITEPF
jgi:hypothetical protein